MANVEVSSSVSAIVETFLRCVEVLKKIKAKPKGRKAKKQALLHRESEARLNNSLARAPLEIEAEYARGVQALGRPFARGDGFTQTLLQTTLAKLNTGLVDIISAFLASKDPTKLRLDYNALAAFSDASCVETKNGLVQLGQRLSQSRMDVHPRDLCGRCGASGRHECVRDTSRGRLLQSSKATKGATPKEYVAGVRHANQMHWAVVRTRSPKKRAPSNSSTSSNGSNVSSSSTAHSFSTNATTLCGTPPMTPMGYASPPPPTNRNGRHPPLQKPQTGTVRPPQQLARQKQSQSPSSPPQPQMHMQTQPPQPLPLIEEHLARIPALWRPTFTHQPANPDDDDYEDDVAAPTSRATSFHHPQQQHQQATATPILRRRLDRPTDSFYSFASESTKIGEIPMHRWAKPYDYAEMERLNAEAGAQGWGIENAPAGPAKAAKKRGFLARMLRIAPLDSIQET